MGYYGLTFCPDQNCLAMAAIINKYVLDSTHGPVEHVEVICVEGHFFNGTADSLLPDEKFYYEGDNE